MRMMIKIRMRMLMRTYYGDEDEYEDENVDVGDDKNYDYD